MRPFSLALSSTDIATVQRDPPPDAEWWDAPLLPNKTYADLDNGGLSNTKIRGDDTPIGPYVQHPIPIPAPWDKNKVDFKPLKLTKKVRLLRSSRDIDFG
jgi:U4/U6 small nuclear ribonucleoprotein PRP3